MTEGLAILPSPELLVVECLRSHHEVTSLVARDSNGREGIGTERVIAGPCIRVIRLPLGGPVVDGILWVDRATLQVEAWAGSTVSDGRQQLASILAATTRAVLDRYLPGTHDLGVVLKVTTSSPGWNPDSVQPGGTGQARGRYQFDAQVTYRPHALTPTTGS